MVLATTCGNKYGNDKIPNQPNHTPNSTSLSRSSIGRQSWKFSENNPCIILDNQATSHGFPFFAVKKAISVNQIISIISR